MDQYTPEELARLKTEDLGPLCKRIVIAFTVLSFVCVCLRLYTRIRYHTTGWEDWTITVAMVSSIGTAVCQILQVNAGNGKHAMFVSFPEGVSEILKYLYFSIITYNITLTVTKISILLQYHRIFLLREMRIPVYVALFIVVVWGITTIFTSIFTCVPIDAYWKVTEQANATCVNQIALWYTNASMNMFTDLMVAIIPVPGIWNLQIPRRQKIALLGILTIGWFICVVSVLRLHALTVFQKHQDDKSYYSGPTAYWSAIEANLTIVCASLPALKPLVVKLVPDFGTRYSSRGRSAASSNHFKLKKICSSKGGSRSDEDKEKLTTHSSASHGQSLASMAPENENFSHNIYVTRQFEQHVENNPIGTRDGEQEMTTQDFLPHGSSE